VILALLLAVAFPSPATSSKAMAATAHPLATEAALSILDKGGNAVDAAIAATFVISVTSQFDAGLGGGGFAMVHIEKTGEMKALDFREVAPQAATRDMYVKDGKVVPGMSSDGHLSVAVPGTVAGLAELHKAHGKLPWRKLVEPAIRVARDGFAVGEEWVLSFEDRKEILTKYEGTKAVFTKNGATYAVGEKLVQRDLKRTLEDIANNPRSFYEGRVAQAIVDDMQKNGGLITADDLKSYAPRWRDPLCMYRKAMRICSMPPPSSGGVHLLQILNLLEGTELGFLGWHDVDSLHRMIESMRIAYSDRATYLGDPAFTKVPVKELTSMSYANERRKEIDPLKARKSTDVKAASPELLARIEKESKDTSHLTVVDAERNAVSLTFTINYTFGSGVIAPGTGVLLNDEMDDFAAAPGVPNAYGLIGGEANSVQPGKIPLSSMTPTIVTKDGKFFMSAGAPGGSTIITTVLQTYLNVVDYGMDCMAAIAAPRIHHQWLPDATRVEKFGIDEGTKKALEARGHKLEVRNYGWGNAMCIHRRDDNTLDGGADPRGEGVAKGL
jgi:gamma-glutamyltranspeptidase / glutathione hydrolase